MPYYESFDEFRERMGCDCDFVNNRYLFRNAAQSNGEFLHNGPPTDPLQIKQLKQEFLKHLLKNATNEFNHIQTYVSEQAAMRLRYSNVPGPREDAIDTLKQLQGRILRLRESIQELETEFPPTPKDIQMEAIARLEEEDKQRVSQLAMKASQITI